MSQNIASAIPGKAIRALPSVVPKKSSPNRRLNIEFSALSYSVRFAAPWPALKAPISSFNQFWKTFASQPPTTNERPRL
jgi:hypothetical protein